MQLALLNIDQQNATFRALYQFAPAAARQQFDETLRRSWIYHDHAIEGIVLTEAELERGIRGEEGKDLCEQQLLDEIHGLYRAIQHVQQDSSPIDLSFMRQVHAMCTPANLLSPSRYRKVDQPTLVYHHTWIPARNISYRLRKLVDLIAEELPRYHPLRGAALLHQQFMEIMPFEQYSGRIGRALYNAWILREGYPSVVFPARLRLEYFDAIQQGVEAMIDLSLRLLEQTLEHGTLLLKNLTAVALR